MGEPVETYWDGGRWRNRLPGQGPLPGAFETRDAAIEAGRDLARIRGVTHIIRRTDDTIELRGRYPRRHHELPG